MKKTEDFENNNANTHTWLFSITMYSFLMYHASIMLSFFPKENTLHQPLNNILKLNILM